MKSPAAKLPFQRDGLHIYCDSVSPSHPSGKLKRACTHDNKMCIAALTGLTLFDQKQVEDTGDFIVDACNNAQEMEKCLKVVYQWLTDKCSDPGHVQLAAYVYATLASIRRPDEERTFVL